MENVGDYRRTSTYYLQRAETCERLAPKATTEENRQILLKQAARWRARAAEERSPPDNG